MRTLATILLISSAILLNAQRVALSDTVNRIDSLGNRQGHWQFTAAMKQRTEFPSEESIVEEGAYLNNQKTGWWMEYYPNGNLRSKLMYSANRPNGTATMYFENGRVIESGIWKGTRWVGEYKMYYDNDTLRYHFNYNNLGQKNGIQYSYYPTGRLAKAENFIDGKEYGWQREYDTDGTLLFEQYYSPIADSCKTIRYPSKNSRVADDYGDGYGRSTELSGSSHLIEEHQLPCVRFVTEKQQKFVDSVFRSTTCYIHQDSIAAASHQDGSGDKILYKCKQREYQGWFTNWQLTCGVQYVFDENGILISVKIYEEGNFTKEIPLH